MPPVDLKGSFFEITWLSSIACSAADNPGIFLFLCLAFISIVAHRMSPPLYPRTQLEQLNRDIDDIWDLFNASGGDVDPDRRRYRRATYNHLKQIQMDACTFEICLLQVVKDDASWREYFRSAKKVYFNARASCKEIDAIRINVKIANMKIKQQHICDEKHSYEGSDEIGPEAATE